MAYWCFVAEITDAYEFDAAGFARGTARLALTTSRI
jgi:hypothetical protein